jgi:hypothetical protein
VSHLVLSHLILKKRVNCATPTNQRSMTDACQFEVTRLGKSAADQVLLKNAAAMGCDQSLDALPAITQRVTVSVVWSVMPCPAAPLCVTPLACIRRSASSGTR